jgi:hypothetical protein
MMGAFTAAFALSITLLTGASRPEIFAATAAYAAVLVVFVSGDSCICIPLSWISMLNFRKFPSLYLQTTDCKKKSAEEEEIPSIQFQSLSLFHSIEQRG